MYFTSCASIDRSNDGSPNRHRAGNYLSLSMPPDANAAVDAVYRSDWGRIVATLIRLVRDFDVAEEAAQEAFTAAVNQWRVSGVPEIPRAWIIQTARHKAIDRIRRRARFGEKLDAYTAAGASLTVEAPEFDPGDIPDDRLRLIFTCCHPALALEAQVALTLRTLGGLETDEIARAFLVRATSACSKRRIGAAGMASRSPRRCRSSRRRCAAAPVPSHSRRRSRPCTVRRRGPKIQTGPRSSGSMMSLSACSPLPSCP